jgi:thymidylate synthase ThyX
MNPKIVVIDDMHPEDVAMLQALYSRSAESVTTHLDKVKASGSGKFMERFYVQYGHKSIADCGSTTVFIENVSILAAKAIQDWPLYSGQETSTRYLDMATRPMIDPIGTPESKAVLDRWMDFYRSKQNIVADEVRRRHPMQPEDDPSAYEQTVKARTFDILRGFLPAAITTQLSWHTNLRQADDHLSRLEYHLLPEVSDLATNIRTEFGKRYQLGFGKSAALSGIGTRESTSEEREERQRWNEAVADELTYEFDEIPRRYFKTNIYPTFRARDHYAITMRPRGCVLPHTLVEMGQLQYCNLLDFGSFRDIQRHRNGVCKMPLLTTKYGFEPWYLDQLDQTTKDEARKLIREQQKAIDDLEPSPEIAQYYTALGFRVQVDLTYTLPAVVYVMELRSGKTVHPTLRAMIHDMIGKFRQHHPSVALHVDMDPDGWTVRRGTQTIVEKESKS